MACPAFEKEFAGEASKKFFMRMTDRLAKWQLVWFGSVGLALASNADTLEFVDGRIMFNCFVRDEGVRLLVWEKFADVGGFARVVPRKDVRSFKIERDETWDLHPPLPDLSVTFIEMNPKLAGLHGRVYYDKYGRPSIGGSRLLKDIGDRQYSAPHEIVKDLKLRYEPMEEITFTAHVKNVGFRVAKPFAYSWRIDGKEIKKGEWRKPLAEMEEATFELKWRWQEGFHTITFRVDTDQEEIATINNEATDPLWGWGLVYIVHNGRVKAWHEKRTAYGTFSFEDFYRWHIDIMNTLFAASVFPSAPDGIKARVRLDRIVYVDSVSDLERPRFAEDGIIYDQGAWIWIDDDDRKGTWKPASKEWRNQTEWSLPHELGHQLGLTDLYVLDYAGDENHRWHDTGEKVSHFMTHPTTMMHWHGPHIWSELCAGYLNMTYDKPRGHFGDFYFAIPNENYLHITDINGFGVPDAKVEIFQRGVVVDEGGETGEQDGVKFYSVIEDGNFGHPVSKAPVIEGTTDGFGFLRLPNRPVQEVRTLNGFHRKPNPFGNINVVGERGLLLVKVTKFDRPCYFYLEIFDFNVAWFRGYRDKYVITLKTTYGSASSPRPPLNVSASRLEGDYVKVRWSDPPMRDQHYLDKVTGYRVYRRVSSDALNDRPWFVVANVGPNEREVVVNLRDGPNEIYWFGKTDRFAVTAVGTLGIESSMVEIVLK